MLGKSFFSLKTQAFCFKNFKNRFKLTLSGISGAFILPIGTIAVCAIFLTLGALIEGITNKDTFFNALGKGIKALSFPIIKALPFIFCIAFAISFTKNNPDAIWCAIICYLIFIGVQNAFIFEKLNVTSEANCKNCNPITGYTVLFEGSGRDSKSMLNLVDKTLGITSLNTSIFGSMILGGIVAPFLVKHFSDVRLPKYISFFSGKRFLPFVASLSSAFLAIIFLIFWPWVGTGVSSLGRIISKTPAGLDSFTFGFLEKVFLPFGLHHIFYSPFWYSSLGGDVVSSINNAVSCGCKGELCLSSGNCCNGTAGDCCKAAVNCCKHIFSSDMTNSASSSFLSLFSGAYSPHTMWQGDSFIGLSSISLPSNTVSFKDSGGSAQSLPVLEFLSKKLNINVGRFTQGKYPIMQFALPAAGLAMIYSAPKERRKESSKIIVPSILSSFILGITEPIEFTFLFLAPTLFYGFHALACGLSFLLMNILGSHIPSVFSGGILELIILGVIPVAKGTVFYNYLLVGTMLGAIYFLVFWTYINFFDLKTPGRELINFGQEQVKDDSVNSKVPEKTRKLAIAFGGWENLSKTSNCASRLRYDIVDKNKVDEEGLKSAGVIAVKWVGENHVQAIVGPQAESINNEMLKWKGEDLGIFKTENFKEKEEILNEEKNTDLSKVNKFKTMFDKKIEISEGEKKILWEVLENLGHKSNIVHFFVSENSVYIELKNMSFLNVEKISLILDAPMYRIVNKNTFELFLGENIDIFYSKFSKFFQEYKEIG